MFNCYIIKCTYKIKFHIEYECCKFNLYHVDVYYRLSIINHNRSSTQCSRRVIFSYKKK